MAGLLSLVGSWVGGQKSGFLQGSGACMYLYPCTPEGNLDPDWMRAFQFWPAEVTDNQSPNWSNKTIPGGSHPLYQYIAGGEHQVTFSAMFARDLYGEFGPLPGQVAESKHDVDVGAAVSYLKSLSTPTYDPRKQFALPPPLLYLCIPNTPITQTGDAGNDMMLCVMSQCDVTWKRWFTDGTPRLAQVNLGFNEVVQRPGATKFYGRSEWQKSAKNYKWQGVGH